LESVIPARRPFFDLRPGWFKRGLIVGAILTPLIGALFVQIPLCPTAALFGMPCPGCGLTRATLAALHGDFPRAFHFHPLFFIATPLYLGVIASIAWSFVRGGTEAPPSKRTSQWITAGAVTLLVLLFIVWLARFFGYFGGPVEVFRLGQHAPQ
jgi:hypothetical protein